MKKMIATASLCLACTAVCADQGHSLLNTATPQQHAPIGVMGDHTHKKGEWIVSYRFMQMDMAGNLQGSNSLDADTIVTTIPNRFANPPMMPPTLRVVPLKMTTTMHMTGLMYAPSNNVTLMMMVNYVEKEMDHQTYMGPMGSNVLGEFSTRTSGLGDTKIGALYSLYKTKNHHFHLNFGLSLPTGSADETGTVLTPMNTHPQLRLPYAMQLGSGTYDAEIGATYNTFVGDLNFGAQIKHTTRTGGFNDEGYQLGDKNQATVWSGYQLSPQTSVSLRIAYMDSGRIQGIDPQIMAPVQTADPESYGKQLIKLGVGINLIGVSGWSKGHRLGFEYSTVVDEDVNGVQMEMQDMLNLGYQYAF